MWVSCYWNVLISVCPDWSVLYCRAHCKWKVEVSQGKTGIISKPVGRRRGMRGACLRNAGRRDVLADCQHVIIVGRREVHSSEGNDLGEVVSLALVGVRGGGNEESAVCTVASEKDC